MECTSQEWRERSFVPFSKHDPSYLSKFTLNFNGFSSAAAPFIVTNICVP